MVCVIASIICREIQTLIFPQNYEMSPCSIPNVPLMLLFVLAAQMNLPLCLVPACGPALGIVLGLPGTTFPHRRMYLGC